MDSLRNAFHYLATESTFRALRHRNYALAELAGWFSGGGFWFYKIALGILTWELTRSGFWLAVVALADAIPSVLLTPLAGAVADRYDRLVAGRIVQASIMVVTSLLAALVIAGWANIFVVIALAVTHGVSGAFWMPLRMALAPTLVPKEDLAAAIALHSTLFNITRFLFPALAIPVLAIWGVGVAFAINAFGYLFYLIALYMIEVVNPDERADRRVSMLANLKEGLIYSKDHPAVKYFLLMLVFSSVFVHAYAELLPGITDKVFGEDPERGVAILVSAGGFGAVLTSFVIGGLTKIESQFKAYFICLTLSVIAVALLGSTNVFVVAIGIMAMVSGAQMGMLVAGQVIIQSTVDGAFRGRVMSLWALTMRGGPALGALLLGSLADLIGFQWPLILGAAIAGSVALYIYSHRRQMFDAVTKERPPARIASEVSERPAAAE